MGLPLKQGDCSRRRDAVSYKKIPGVNEITRIYGY